MAITLKSNITTQNIRKWGYAKLLEVPSRSQESSPVHWNSSQGFLLASSPVPWETASAQLSRHYPVLLQWHRLCAAQHLHFSQATLFPKQNHSPSDTCPDSTQCHMEPSLPQYPDIAPPQEHVPALNSTLHVTHIFTFPHDRHKEHMDRCKGIHCLTDPSQIQELHPKYFVSSQQSQVETPQSCTLKFYKILWLELWQLWSQSTWILFFKRTITNAKVQAQSQCHSGGRICTTEKQSWAALQGLVCMCTYEN